MAAGRGDFEGALGGLLAFDVLEIERRWRRFREPRLGRGEYLCSLEVVDERQERGCRQDVDPAGPGCLAAACRRADEAALAGCRTHRRRQHPGHRQERAIERQLAQRHIALDILAGHHVHGRQKPERDGKIEMASFLEKIGRREVYGNAFGRQR